MNPSIQLDALLNKEGKLMDTVKALYFVHKKKDIVEAKSVVWIIQRGHVPRLSDHTISNKISELLGWLPGELNMAPRHW